MGKRALTVMIGALALGAASQKVPASVSVIHDTPFVSTADTIEQVSVDVPRNIISEQDLINLEWENENLAVKNHIHSHNVWYHVFNTFTDRQYGIFDDETSDLLAIIPTDARRWERDAQILDSRFQDALDAGLRWSTDWNHFEDRAEDFGLALRRVNGRKNVLDANIPSGAQFLDVLCRINEYNRLGCDASALYVTEGQLNGRAKSAESNGRLGHALGIGQIVRSNVRLVQPRLARLGVRFEAYDLFSGALMSSAIIQTLSKQFGSTTGAMQAYHSGPGNAIKVCTNGTEILDIEICNFTGYLAGIISMHEVPISRSLLGNFRSRSRSYVANVHGNVRTVQELRQEVPQMKVYRYKVDEWMDIADFVELTGQSSDNIVMFNPNYESGIGANGFFHSSVQVEGIGEEQTVWDTPESAELLKVWRDWKVLDLPHTRAGIDSIRAYGNRFAEAGNPYMKVAIDVWGIPALNRVVRGTDRRYINNAGRRQTIQQHAPAIQERVLRVP